MKKKTLKGVRDIVKERWSDYGDPKVNIGRIAKWWSSYCGKDVTGVDVCLMMIMLKLSRELVKHKDDNMVDIIGYLKIAQMFFKEKK
jgi:hypothetical protein